MKRQCGLTLIEMLVALLLLSLALSGLLSVWALSFNLTRHSQRIGAGYNIARHEAERAHNLGYMMVPEGTETRDYDGQGEPITSGTPIYTARVTTITAPNVDGTIDTRCLRSLALQVTAHQTGEVVFVTTLYLSRGGP